MLKLSSLAAIAVIGCAILQPATAQTPGAAAAEKSGSASSLNSGNLPHKPARVAPPASFSKSARPQPGRAATAAAGKRHASARTAAAGLQASSARSGRTAAGLQTTSARSGKTSAAMRSKGYANLRSNRTARSAASAFAFLPARAAPQERARTADARRKALHGLPTSAVASKKPKSG